MNAAVVLIPTLILVSGLVAFVGNLVGRAIGRRRLAVFGLRPRYTAQAITVITGMLITVVTLAVVLLVSNDARQALFHLQEIRRQIVEQEQKLGRLQGGDIIYLHDQEVLRTIIDGREPLPIVRSRVQVFFDLAAQAARQRGIASPDDHTPVLVLSPSGVTVNDIAADLFERHEPMVVRMLSTSNTVSGTPSLQVSVISFPNRLVFRANEAIATAKIDGRDSREQVESGLLKLIAEVGAIAKKHGVISPAFGPASSPPDIRLDPAVLSATMERVQAKRAPVEVVAVATADTLTIGPVLVAFK
jgi:uncharacterized protein (DUF3084 family)